MKKKYTEEEVKRLDYEIMLRIARSCVCVSCSRETCNGIEKDGVPCEEIREWLKG